MSDTTAESFDTWFEWILLASAVYVITLFVSRMVAGRSSVVAGLIYAIVAWGVYLVWTSHVSATTTSGITDWVRKGVNQIFWLTTLPLSSAYIVCFLFLLYVSLLFAGVPLGDEKPFIVRIVEQSIFVLFIMSLVELCVTTLFGTSVLTPLRTWTNRYVFNHIEESESTTSVVKDPADSVVESFMAAVHQTTSKKEGKWPMGR